MNTYNSNTTEQCKATMGKERIIKSALSGGSIGLAVGFAIAFITWFFEFKGMWLSIGVGLGSGVAASLLFYFFVFKTTTRDVMARVDRAGLDERMITMLEFQGDDSYMASRQRTDAQAVFTAAVNKSAGSLIKTKIPAFIIALTCVSGGAAVPAVTVTACSDYGVIPTGMQLITGDWEGNPTISNGRLFEVVFRVDEQGGGKLNGELVQTLKAGERAKAVEAIPDRGLYVANQGYVVQPGDKSYYFVKWVDESDNEYLGSPVFAPTVTGAKVFTAVFEEIDPDNDEYYSYYYDPDQQGEPGDGDPGDGDGEPQDSMPDDPGEPPDPNNSAGSGSADTNDTVIDGETQYGDVFGEGYQGDANGDIADGRGDLPPELADSQEGYIGML